MLIKWIVCTVPDEQRTAFSQAQQAWSIIADADGFIGQIGGWNHRQPDQACILGLWHDITSYQTFMDKIHDAITDTNAQAQTYSAIDVGLFHQVLDIVGEASTLADALTEASILRVADCMVKPAQQSHFVQVQGDVWNIGMAKAGGMLGGVFNQHDHMQNQYLVTTFWRDMPSHQHYVDQYLPTLRETANVAQDLDNITGYLVELEPKWCVLPEREM